MSSELIADNNAPGPIQASLEIDSKDIIDSEAGGDIRLGPIRWWRTASSVANDERCVQALDLVSRHGRRCVITGETGAVQMVQLISSSTRPAMLRKLYHSFGRPIDVNNRWFNLYLRADWHHDFKNTPNSWALIPSSETTTQIANRMREEKERRLLAKTTGPWPDFRQPSWFPTTKMGYSYHFIPLGIAHSGESIEISRRKLIDDPGAHINDRTYYYAPSYAGFPVLTLHIHPYAAILNAFPKLRNHLKTHDLPPSANESYVEMEFIYNTLWNAYKDCQSTRPSVVQRPQIACGSNPTSTTSGPDIRRSECLAEAKNNDWSTMSSRSGLARQDSYDDLPDDLDSNSKTLWNDQGLFTEELTSTGSGVPPKDEFPSLQDLIAVPDRDRMDRWIAEVEGARGREELIELEDDSSYETSEYIAEPVFPPPTLDWHEWTSEFAPRSVILPTLKGRGVLSSNDWVEIHEFPSLVRKLDNNMEV